MDGSSQPLHGGDEQIPPMQAIEALFIDDTMSPLVQQLVQVGVQPEQSGQGSRHHQPGHRQQPSVGHQICRGLRTALPQQHEQSRDSQHIESICHGLRDESLSDRAMKDLMPGRHDHRSVKGEPAPPDSEEGHGQPALHHSGYLPGRSHEGPTWRGRRMVTVVPVSSSLVNSTVPPCTWAIPRTIAKPSPSRPDFRTCPGA